MNILKKKKEKQINFVATTNLLSDNSMAITRDASGRIQQVMITDGVDSKTMVLGRNAQGRVVTVLTTLS